MFWNGTRWIDERAPAAPPPPGHRRARDWLATGVMILGVAALAIPFMATSAASNSADRLIASWSNSYETRVFQESTVLATYAGSWARQQNDQFLGSYAAVSTQADAAVDFAFTGSAVSWIGSKGPNQGRAWVYVDGTLVQTVDTYSRTFRSREMLFTASFSGVGPHTLTIQAGVTTVRRAVSVDAFVVQGPKQDGSSAPTPTPVPTSAPTPTPVPTTPASARLVISAVGPSNITQTGATIIWTVSAPATGQVEYGTTLGHGSFSAPENSYIYTTHIQQLSGLAPGTLYHYLAHSTDAAGVSAVSADYVFATLSAPTPTSTPAPTLTPAPTPTPTPTPALTPAPTRTSAPTPTPTPRPTATPTPAATATPTPAATPTPTPAATPAPAPSAYGSVQGDSRNNYLIGGPNSANLAYRFRASTTSAANSIRVQQRGNGGANTYSGGNGGTIKVSIQTDRGGAPSGTVLSSLTFAPGDPAGNWEDWNLLTFPTPATLTAGQMYHVVFDNVDAAPNTNWISLNALWYVGAALTPRQPTFSDDYGLIYRRSDMYAGAWHLMPNDTPIMDLAYANGTHDGMNYIGSMGPNYGSVSGPSQMVREHFTVSSGDRTVTSASVKVKRISGTSPLTIRLETGNGTLIESVDVAASSIALGNLPTSDTAAALGGNTWAKATFLSPHVLTNGATYNLVLSAPAGTQYIAVPVQEGTTKGMFSRAFTDGDGQRTTDGGVGWAYLYPYLDNGRQDLQFYFR